MNGGKSGVTGVSDRQRARKPLFRREERREFRYRLSIFCAEFLSWLFWLWPPPLRRWFADRCGELFFRLSHTYRDNVLDNISHVMPLADSGLTPEEAARSIFHTSAQNFLDLIIMPRVRRRKMVRSMSLVEGSWEQLDEALAAGNGVVLLTAHLGCFDYIGSSMTAMGYKLIAVTGRTTSRFIFDGVTHLRTAKGIELVEPTPSGVRRVIHCLRRGYCAVFLTDRDFFQNGRPVVFFDRETTLPPGPVRIARDTGAYIIPLFTRRAGKTHEMVLKPAFKVEKTGTLDADIDRGLEQVTRLLEAAISENIAQWAMFQRVWPEPLIEPVRVFPVGSPLESELLEKVAAAVPERLASAAESRGSKIVPPRPTDHTDPPPQS